MKIPLIKLHKPIRNMSSQQYHSTAGTWSSTQFKDLLDDEDIFIKKYINKTIPKEENPVFDVGTYFHTGTLEPHKLKDDCIVFPGKVRRGKDWEKFKAKHKHKAIVSAAQKGQAEGLVRAVKNSPVAQEYLEGDPEVSLFIEIIIYRGQILAPHFNMKLTLDGWEYDQPINDPKSVKFWSMAKKKGFRMIVKVRADIKGNYFISDLKSTTGNARSNKSMREKISYYNYDLSASLYVDMFSLYDPSITDFIWIFASKDFFNSKSYRASPNNIRVGRAKYMKAMIRMADCAAVNWQSVDYLDVLEPLPFELEHLREKDTDLL